MVRRQRVDPLAAGERSAPHFVVPFAAEDPLPSGQLASVLADALSKFGGCGGFAEVHPPEVPASPAEVAVRINKTREHRFSARLHAFWPPPPPLLCLGGFAP